MHKNNLILVGELKIKQLVIFEHIVNIKINDHMLTGITAI
jgi:hypothetical protein